MEMTREGKYIIAINGGREAIYGIRLAAEFLSRGSHVHLICKDNAESGVSEGALKEQTDMLRNRYPERFVMENNRDYECNLYKGAVSFDAMIVVPASIQDVIDINDHKTDSLILKTADNARKQNRRLILVANIDRFTAENLETMLSLAKEGADIIPAAPPFFHIKSTLEDMIDYTVSNVLNLLNIDNTVNPKW
ncbi:MAG: hypothetical protein K6E39_07030 [Lachnospiraceae bacterium]|nr:hypothetical protein [Lachnospiraceae bacterium]